MSDITLNDSQMEAAGLVIAGLQKQIEHYCNRPVEVGVYEERLEADLFWRLNFRVTPVVRILSVKEEPGFNFHPGAAVPAEVFVDETTGVEYPVQNLTPFDLNFAYVSANGLDLRQTPTYGTFVVRYIGGYDGTQDAALQLAIVRKAAADLTANHDDTISIKGGSTSVPVERGPAGFTDEELRQFDRIRRRVVF